jgi:hypothetical protein
MKNIIFLLLVSVFFSCKKEETPEPIPPAKSGTFRLEFHCPNNVDLDHYYNIDNKTIVNSVLTDTIKVYEFNITTGQRVEAKLFSKSGNNGNWKTVTAIWMGDTIFYNKAHDKTWFNIVL